MDEKENSAWMRRVREWRKQKEQLVSTPDKKRRLGTPGRKALLPDMEEELAAWIEDQRSQHLRVTRTAIQMKARVASGIGRVWSFQGVIREVSPSTWIHPQTQDDSQPVTS